MNVDEIDDLLDQLDNEENFNENSMDNVTYDLNTQLPEVQNDNIIITNDVNINEERITNNDVIMTDNVLNIVDVNMNDEDFSNNRQRAKISLPENWKRNSNRSLRMKGKSYLGYRRTQKQVFHDVNRKARDMGSTCTNISCKKSSKRMCHRFSDEDRLNTFKYFWSILNWDQKKIYVNTLVKKVPVKQKKTEASISRRNYTLFYFLKLSGDPLNVCKKMFLNTLGLGENQVHNWCSNDEVSTKKHIGTKSRPSKKNSDQKEFIKAFLNKLPKMESHYCRKSTSKLYLEPLVQSKLQLYKMYINECNLNEKTPLSRKYFNNAFEENNLSLFSPKKDQCDICCGHKTGNINDQDWNKHIQDKNRSREEKEMDKQKALSEEAIVFTMDLQAVKVCPLLKASAVYYKCKLCVHNFTMYNLGTHECMCYWWNETQCNLTASAFTSCIIDQLTLCYDKNPNKNIILWSDGCFYQNKNTVLSNALLEFSVTHKVIIEQKYLTKGHIQMECDSVHSVIERKLKNTDIHLPSDYIKITKSARSKPFPYKIKDCDISFFLDFQKGVYRYDNIRPGKTTGEATVNQIKALRYNYNGTIEYKLNFDDEYCDLAIAQKNRKTVVIHSPIKYEQLHKSPLKIPKSKWQDLQQLKAVLPKDCHAFYDQIKY